MSTNDRPMMVVAELNVMIDNYGLAEVQHALQYISTFPTSKKQYRFPNPNGADWYLSETEFKRIESVSPRVNKIQAIKMFREITSCGLKEAKDAIEGYYDTGYKY